MSEKPNIAIVGTGISGLSAAWALKDVANVTIFEADDRPGGHAHTVDIDIAGRSVAVDVGFIVCNPLNYPNFMNFMRELDVETIESDMSFAVSDPQGYEWSSNPGGLFAYKRNLFRPGFWSLLTEILRFNKTAQEDAAKGDLSPDISLKDYLDLLGMSLTFREQYIYPMGAAIWSTPEADMQSYPAKSFLDFFNNHRLLHRERPKWRTIAGGSRSYVSILVAALSNQLKLATPVESIERHNGEIRLRAAGTDYTFDEVILSCSAPIARSLLGDGFEHQKSVLAQVQTVPNKAYLHSDVSLMPKRRAAWASWNVLRGQSEKVSLSYWMNKLQALPTETDVFVTLNPETLPDPAQTYGEYDFEHPFFTNEAADRVSDIKRLNGRDGLWFAGAWMGHGFHEDGLKSGLSVAVHLGAQLPWEPVGLCPYTDKTPEPLNSPPQLKAVNS